jgi:hypothetical protein
MNRSWQMTPKMMNKACRLLWKPTTKAAILITSISFRIRYRRCLVRVSDLRHQNPGGRPWTQTQLPQGTFQILDGAKPTTLRNDLRIIASMMMTLLLVAVIIKETVVVLVGVEEEVTRRGGVGDP